MAQYDVFISYSRKDTAIANEICNALDQNGITYFIDRQGINAGMEFPRILAEAIISSKLVVFLASKNSYSSKFTLNEITFAFNTKIKDGLIPVIVDNSNLPIELEFLFAGTNWVILQNTGLDYVVNSIKQSLEDYDNILCSIAERISNALYIDEDIEYAKQLNLELKNIDSLLYQFAEGLISEKEGLYKQAYQVFRNLCTSNMAYAEYYLATLYQDERYINIIQDWNPSFPCYNDQQGELFYNAYTHGFLQAAYNYSTWLTVGRIPAKSDIQKSIEVLSELAEPSSTSLRRWEIYNKLTGDLDNSAYSFIYEAAESLSQLYEDGGILYSGVTKVDLLPSDLEKSFYYALIAANDPDPDLRTGCIYGVAECYEKGIGVTKNIGKAIYWYNKLVQYGEGWAIEATEAIRRITNY